MTVPKLCIVEQSKAQAETLTQQLERAESSVKEAKTKLTATQEKLTHMEADLKTKVGKQTMTVKRSGYLGTGQGIWFGNKLISKM